MICENIKIPAISVWQPWAQWIVMGWKTIEVRKRRIQCLFDQTIVIHAAKKWDTRAIPAAMKYLSPEQLERSFNMHIIEPALIGTVHVFGDGRVIEKWSDRALCDCSYEGSWGLYLKDAREFEKPIHYKGRQGVFYIPQEQVYDEHGPTLTNTDPPSPRIRRAGRIKCVKP